MKIGKKRAVQDDIRSSSKPSRNQSKKSLLVIVIAIITAILIVWVFMLSREATRTVTVCVWDTSLYKNQQITENQIRAYDMLEAEYEKYATVSDDGVVSRRIVKWDERDELWGAYAAYPMFANTFVEYDTLYFNRVDNSDSVMYSFPGKNIVSLDIATSDLQTFKTFLEPGDRIDITAIYKRTATNQTIDEFGNEEQEEVTYYTAEPLFKDIYIADLLNSQGDSILDIYADYNSKSVTQQAALSSSEIWLDSVVPSKLLLALTPEEQELYYLTLAKGDCEFRVSLPQRID